MKEASDDEEVYENSDEEEIKNMVMRVTLNSDTISLVERNTCKGLMKL